MKFNPFSSLVEITGSKKLGNILLNMGAITEEDLQHALHIKKENPDKLIGEIIVEKGFASHKHINIALDEQRKESRLGQLLVSSGLLKDYELEDALSEQKATGDKLGEILIRKGYSNEIQIKNALNFQRRDNRLGTLILRKGLINEEELNRALDYQESTGVLLGEALIELGFLTSLQLTEALLEQSRYITN